MSLSSWHYKCYSSEQYILLFCSWEMSDCTSSMPTVSIVVQHTCVRPAFAVHQWLANTVTEITRKPTELRYIFLALLYVHICSWFRFSRKTYLQFYSSRWNVIFEYMFRSQEIQYVAVKFIILCEFCCFNKLCMISFQEWNCRKSYCSECYDYSLLWYDVI
jgi:hypothetical protein